MRWEPKICVHGVSMADACYRCDTDYRIQQGTLLVRGHGALSPPSVPHQIEDSDHGGGIFDERDDGCRTSR